MPPRAPIPIAILQWLLLTALVAMGMAWTWAIRRLLLRQPILPEPGPRLVPWRNITFLLLVLESVAVALVVSQVYVAAMRFRPDRRPLTPREQMVVQSLINLGLVLIIPATLALVSGGWLALRRLGIGREGLGGHVRQGALAFLLLTPVVYALQFAASLIWSPNKHPVERMLFTQPSMGMALFTFISAVILAPGAEELLFRGIIQNWLTGLFLRPTRRTEAVAGAVAGDDAPVAATEDAPEGIALEAIDPEVRPEWAPPRAPIDPAAAPEGVPDEEPRSPWVRALPIVLTSAFFALMHMSQWPAPIAIFLLSLGLGTVYQRSGSLVTSFTTHAMFNGFSTLMLFHATLLAPTPDEKKTVPPVEKAVPQVTDDREAGPAPGGVAGGDGLRRRRIAKIAHPEIFSIGAGE